MELAFRILGPLEVSSPAGPIRLGGPRQRSVLAILLLEANRVVSIDRLADELYGEAPPVSAVTQVHRQISELRALLGAETIETSPPGYRIRVAQDGLDLQRAERAAGTARAALAAGRPAEAVARSRDALEEWRGEPLADLSFEPFAWAAAERLRELRLTVAEQLMEAELERGGGAGLVAELELLVAGNPLRERLRGQLMVALYRAGRQAEALETFRDGRSALVEAFGLEPTPALRQLETRVLQQDPSLLGAATAAEPEAPRTVLLAAGADAGLAALADAGRALAALGRHELLLARVVSSEQELAGAIAATRACRESLVRDGLTCRSAAFVSRSPGEDLARFALAHGADLLVADLLGEIAGDGSLADDLALLLERSPCDVALLARSRPIPVGDGVRVVFGGGEHDWAAAELGAWLCAGTSAGLELIGTRGRRPGDGGDASRLLASASIAIQQLVGVDATPVLADAGPAGLVEAAGTTGVAVVGLSPRWRREGLGASRRALLASGAAVLLVHRGARPGGLAPREGMTRFTWTIAAGR